MRLTLTLSPDLVVKEAPHDQLVAIKPGMDSNVPDAILTYGPLRIKPDEPRAWHETVATGDLVPGTQATLGRVVDNHTSLGWPVRLVECEITKTTTGEVVEVRLCGFFTFLEHAGAAMLRTASRERMAANAEHFVQIFDTARPDWRGEPASVSELWDLQLSHAHRLGDLALPGGDAPSPPAPETEHDPLERLQRGVALLDASRPADAILELEAAAALAPKLAAAHYYHGVALAEHGRRSEAIAAWEHAAVLAPNQPDAIYNTALARFALGDLEGALRDFNTVTKLDPGDFLVIRKIVQCLTALGRYDEAQAARILFRERWSTTNDPRARFIHEYVFDQFTAEGVLVQAIETLRPPPRPTYPVFAFRAFEVHGTHEHPIPLAVLIETGDRAIAAGTPYVVGVERGTKFEVVAALAQLPAYPEIKRQVTRLIGEALKAAAAPAT